MYKRIVSYHSALILVLYLLLASSPSPLYANPIEYNYEVEFTGVDEETRRLLTQESRLITLINSPPLTATALQYRINDDIIGLVKVLQSAAYYNPTIQHSIADETCPIKITLQVNPGPIYHFNDFKVTAENDCCHALCEITLDDLGVTLGTPAYPAAIIEAEEDLFSILENGDILLLNWSSAKSLLTSLKTL